MKYVCNPGRNPGHYPGRNPGRYPGASTIKLFPDKFSGSSDTKKQRKKLPKILLMFNNEIYFSGNPKKFRQIFFGTSDKSVARSEKKFYSTGPSSQIYIVHFKNEIRKEIIIKTMLYPKLEPVGSANSWFRFPCICTQ